MSNNDHWYPAYVGIGSNLNGPTRQIDAAFDLLAGIPQTRLVARSSLYRSAPFGGIEQPDYVNAAAALLTQLGARQLFEKLQEIELQRGRERGEARWGPRVLDLDLLVYGTVQLAEPDLVIPHPGIAGRNFVLLPLADIAPALAIPGIGTLASLAVSMDEPQISRIA